MDSLKTLTYEDGTVAQRFAFCPWGNRRDPYNWAERDERTSWIVNRGFTMHEHLDAFSIINMNGRIYDPLTAQFFSPDPFIQTPSVWLNFNRFSYVNNNPFRYTDPTGEVRKSVTRMHFGHGHVSAVPSFSMSPPRECPFIEFRRQEITLPDGWRAPMAISDNPVFSGGNTNNAITAPANSPMVNITTAVGNSNLDNWNGFPHVFHGGNTDNSLLASVNSPMGGVNTLGGKGSNGNARTTQQKIVERAVYFIGRTDYNIYRRTGNFLSGNPKCNLFVYDVTTWAGASPGLPNQPGRSDLLRGARGGRPPTTSQWADPNFVIPGWTVVSSPAPGDVASFGGHVGIVYSNILTISATPRHGVVRNDWGFRPGHYPIFRRFFGH